MNQKHARNAEQRQNPSNPVNQPLFFAINQVPQVPTTPDNNILLPIQATPMSEHTTPPQQPMNHHNDAIYTSPTKGIETREQKRTEAKKK